MIALFIKQFGSQNFMTFFPQKNLDHDFFSISILLFDEI